MRKEDLLLEFNSVVRSYNEQCKHNGGFEGTRFIDRLVQNAELLAYLLHRYCKTEVSFERFPKMA